MIKSKDDLSLYLKADKQVYGIIRKYPKLIGDENWKFQIALRMEEYHANQSGIYHRIMKKIWYLIHRHYGIKMGWDIPINVFGPGLKINHFGLIVINDNVRIGAFCDIHQGVNIGQHGNCSTDVPIIGNNVWIGPGAKLFGKIVIADGCAIGANSVVNKSFEEKGISIAGIPAKKVSNIGHKWIKTI